jgi:glycosyltransferase involved in cell wall biosynthesis
MAKARGRVLMSFGQTLYKRILAGKPPSFGHPSAWCNLVMMRGFLDRGFAVDCIDWDDAGSRPDGTFDAVFDVIQNLERLQRHAGKGASRILFPWFMQSRVHNSLSRARHVDLLNRRGIDVPPNKLVQETRGAEIATDMLFPGGEYALESYRASPAKIYRLPQIRPFDLEVNRTRDLSEARRHFLWIGGHGKVHKGLDLALEAFERMPDTHLWVCGEMSAEPAFEAAFRRELNELPNVHLLRFVDTQSEQWAELTTRCLGVVSATAAEVRVTSMLASMRCGLIPLLSAGNDIDAPRSTITLETNSVEAIQTAVRHAQGLTDQELLHRSEAAREEVGSLCGREGFVDGVSAVFDRLLGPRQVDFDMPDLTAIRGIGKIEVLPG